MSSEKFYWILFFLGQPHLDMRCMIDLINIVLKNTVTKNNPGAL